MTDASQELPDTEERRGFVKFCAGAIGFLLGLVPVAFGSLFFLDPILRKKKAQAAANDPHGVQKDDDGFINLKIRVDHLPEDGTPQSYKVYDDKVDAWNKFKNVEIGTVWLRRDAQNNVIAFNTICPHLGCAVDYRMAQKDFYCPCHTSMFNLKGERQNRIPPRDMDPLEVRLKPETEDEIWLKYQNYRAATEKRIPV